MKNEQPLLILGCERRECYSVTGKDLLIYVLMIIAFTAICSGLSLVVPDSEPQELRSTDRTVPAETFSAP